MENKKNIFKMMNANINNLEKQLVYLNECIYNLEDLPENISSEHYTYLCNKRVQLTLLYIAKYNKYPNVKKYYKN